MAESSTFVGTHYILGSYVFSLMGFTFADIRSRWYKPEELGKRSGIFTSSGLGTSQGVDIPFRRLCSFKYYSGDAVSFYCFSFEISWSSDKRLV